jgi:predicted dehydrogenase
VQFPQRRLFEIYGDRGTLSYDFMSGEIRYFHYQQEYKWEDMSVAPIMERWDDLFRKEHEAILSARSIGAPSLVSGNDGLRALEIADRAIRDADRRCLIDLKKC